MKFAPGTDYNNPNVQQQLDRFHDNSDGGNRSDRWRGKGEGKTAGRQALEQYIKSEGERVAGGDYTRVGNNGYRSRENASRPRPQSRSSRYNPANRYNPYGDGGAPTPSNPVPNPQDFGKDTINRPENNSYGNRPAPQFNVPSYGNGDTPSYRMPDDAKDGYFYPTDSRTRIDKDTPGYRGDGNNFGRVDTGDTGNNSGKENQFRVTTGGDWNTWQEAQQDNRMDNIGQNSTFGDYAKVGINNAVQIVNQGSGRNPLANMQLATAYNALNSNALERSKTSIDGASRAGQAIKDGEKYTGSRDIVEKIYNNVGEDQNYWQSSAELYRARSFGDRNKYKVPAWTPPKDPEKEDD